MFLLRHKLLKDERYPSKIKKRLQILYLHYLKNLIYCEHNPIVFQMVVYLFFKMILHGYNNFHQSFLFLVL